MRNTLTNKTSPRGHDQTDRSPEMEGPLVFVLILNYQSLEDTIDCVTAIRTSSYPNYRILVIDNASPDDSGRQLASKIPPTEFLQLPKNTGYAGGNNTGIRIAMQANAKYIFILNPDVRVAPDTISMCVETAEADPSIGALNPVQVVNDGYTIDHKFRNAVLLPTGRKATVFKAEDYRNPVEVRELLGAALFISAETIKRVGGFDPLYFAYGEETDLCRRIRYHGLRLVVVGEPPIQHLRTKEATAVSDRVLFLRLKGMYLGILKEPRRSFLRSLRLVTGQFLSELTGGRRNEYPFNQYQVTRLHCIRAFGWVLVHLMSIRAHRRLELQGRAHA